MDPFRHFILTLFNVRVSHGGGTPPPEEWLRHRFDLFEGFCYPSVRAQTNQDFRWLVFFDAGTPAPYRDRITRLQVWDPFVPVFVDEALSVESFARMKKELIASAIPPGTPHLITTTLDNDDALHAQYVEFVHREFHHQSFEFLNFTNGYVYDSERCRLYGKRHLSNPFVSLIEGTGSFRTIWCGPHTEFPDIGPVRQVETPPAWLQVVHGRNVSNNVGLNRRIPLNRLHDGFQALSSVVPRREAGAGIVLENAVTVFQSLLSRFRQ